MTIDIATQSAGKPQARKLPAPTLRALLHRAGQVADELWFQTRIRHGLSPRQYDVLLAVQTLQPCSQTKLVTATGIDRSTLADIVRRLVRKKLVDRKRSNRNDAREQVVKLTGEGREALQDTKRSAANVDAQLQARAGFHADDVQDLTALLRRLVEGSVA